jgi:hypothetical protein
MAEIYEVGSRTPETIEVVNRVMKRTETEKGIKLSPWKCERRLDDKGMLLYIYIAERIDGH